MSAKSDLRERTAYDEDFLLWSEEQAELLRRRAAARPEAFAGLDIENLAEEIGDLGKSQLRAAESFLLQLFLHLIKIASDPAASSVEHWFDEADRLHIHFQRSYWPSMRQRIDLALLWGSARKRAHRRLARHGRTMASRVPVDCPVTLAELLSDDFDAFIAVRRLGISLPAAEREESP